MVSEQVIGVISDTHLTIPEMDLTALFKTGGVFDGINFLVHAGDFTSMQILSYFKGMKNFTVLSVRGNMDNSEIRMELPEKKHFEILGQRIGIMHGWGAPLHLERKIYQSFNSLKMDCIIFGHTHQPTNKFLNKTLMFNPGAFRRDFFTNRRTVGKLFVSSSGIRGEIITIP